ncbi:MAG: NUDIX hydrolase [Bacillota bacterium]|nr:NUDIX hydrolase [Bacillota bacterium]
MEKVKFYDVDAIKDDKLMNVVIVARYNGKWVFVRHNEKTTWELAGGERMSGEKINETAARKLFQQTRARKFTLYPICLYSVREQEAAVFGSVFYAHIEEIEKPSNSVTALFDEIPESLTYQHTHPFIYERVLDMLSYKNERVKITDLID